MAESIDLLTAYVRIRQKGLSQTLRSLDRIKKKAEEIRKLDLDDNLTNRLGYRPAIYKSDFVGADSLEKSAARVRSQQEKQRKEESRRLQQQTAAEKVAAEKRAALKKAEVDFTFAHERSVAARRLAEQARADAIDLSNARKRGGALQKIADEGAKQSAKRAAEFGDKIDQARIRERGNKPAIFKSNFVGLEGVEASATKTAKAQAAERKKIRDQEIADGYKAYKDIRARELRAYARRLQEARDQKKANADAYRDQLNYLKQQKAQRDADRRDYLAKERQKFLDTRAYERRALARRKEAAKEEARLQREAAARLKSRNQGLNSLSLELGFLGGRGTQQLGNLYRIAGIGRQIAQSFGYSAAASTGLGVALAGLAGVAKVVLTAFSALIGVANRLVRVLTSSLTAGIKFLFGPTLTLIGLFNRLAQNMTLVSVAAAGLAARELVNVGRQFERIRNQFQFVFGSNAKSQMQQLTSAADRLGLPLASTAEQYAKISVAARGAGISQQTVENLFKGIGRAAVTLGLDAERVNGVFFAFEQIISKGKVSAEELRRQLGDRLPGAFSLAARALGKTTAELDKLLETGQLGSKEFVNAVSRQLNREFFISSLVQSRSLAASMIRLDNSFVRLKATIATGAVQAFTSLVRVFTTFLNKVAEGRTIQVWIKLISDSLYSLAGNFGAALNVAQSFLRKMYLPLREIAKSMVVINSVAIAGLIEGLKRASGILRQFAGLLQQTVLGITGIKIEGFTDAFSFALAITENISKVIDVIVLRIKEIPERFRTFFDTLVGNGFFQTLYRAVQTFGAAFAAELIKGVAKILFGSGLASKLGITEEIKKALGLATALEISGKLFLKSGELFADAVSKGFTTATSRTQEIAAAMDRVGRGIDASLNIAKARAYLQQLKSNLSELLLTKGLGKLTSLFGVKPAGSPEDALAAKGGSKSNDYVDIAGLRDALESSINYDIAVNSGRTASATVAMEAILFSMANEAKNFYGTVPELIKAAAATAFSSLPGGGVR